MSLSKLAAFRLYFLCVSLLAVVLPLAIAQHQAEDSPNPGPSDSSPSRCLFSCPETDLQSWPLVKRPWIVGWDSYYSIFECVYAIQRPKPTLELTEHKCSYDKQSGLQRLAATGDNCPLKAVPCPHSPSSNSVEEDDLADVDDDKPAHAPKFSNQEKTETPPWVENGRFLTWMSEHPPS